MKIGVYSRKHAVEDNEPITVIRHGLYDVDAGEWEETSSGYLVSRASATPSPEELKIRFDLERHDRFVATPEYLETQNVTVTVAEHGLTVEEGHARREEQGGPLATQVEKQRQKDAGVVVIPDEYESERGIPDNAVRESDWDSIDFADEFDFEFYTPETEPTAE